MLGKIRIFMSALGEEETLNATSTANVLEKSLWWGNWLGNGGKGWSV